LTTLPPKTLLPPPDPLLLKEGETLGGLKSAADKKISKNV